MILAGLAHILVSTLVAYAMALVFGSLTPWIAAFSLAAGSVAAWYQLKTWDPVFENWRVNRFAAGELGWIERLLFAFILFAAFRHFAWMFYVSGTEYRTLSLNNFGDLPLHLNYVRYLAHGTAFPPVNPIYALEPLRYPIGIDLYNALWEALGVRLQAHFFVVGMFATLASLVALRNWAGWWGIGGFFLSGALMSRADANLGWKSLFLTVFITQRGMLFALPAGVLVLWCARLMYRGEWKPSRTQTISLGLLWGSLSLFHLHTFFIISVLLFALGLVYYSRGFSVTAFRQLLLPALLPGAAFTMYLTGFFQKAGVAHWRAGWMAGPEGFIRFAATNFGIWLAVMIALPVIIFMFRRNERSREARDLFSEWAVYVGLFALFLNLMLAPWEWDNIKVLIWPYVGLLAVAHHAFLPKADRVWNVPVQAVLAGVLLLTGATNVGLSINGTQSSVGLTSISELASAEGALKNLSKDAVFAAAPTHDHSLAFLGYRRVLGYEGHIWSHGINSRELSAALDKVMRGAADWQEAIKALNATHIYWGPAERALYGDVAPPWKSVLPNISSVAGYEIYEIKGLQ